MRHGWQASQAQYWVTQFLRGARRLRPPRIRRAAAWDLPLLLQALGESLFEPRAGVTLRNASMKTAFLLAITTGKHVSELHVLSVLHVFVGRQTALWLNIAFLQGFIPQPC